MEYALQLDNHLSPELFPGLNNSDMRFDSDPFVSDITGPIFEFTAAFMESSVLRSRRNSMLKAQHFATRRPLVEQKRLG